MTDNPPDLQAPDLPVFITGATGFIGRRLARALLEQGHGVRAMVRPGQGADSRVPPGCEAVEVDLADTGRLADIAAGSCALVYCAGAVRGRRPDSFAAANVSGVASVLEALGRIPEAPPLLLLSSLAASRPHLSDYARSKYEGEQLLRGNTDLPWTILRPPAVYGPGDREMLPLLKMVRRGLVAHVGPRDQRLSLLHVDDLAAAVLFWLAAAQNCRHRTYAIDDGKAGGYDWPEIGVAVSGGSFRMYRLPRFAVAFAARANLLFSSLFGYQPMLTPGKVRELTEPEWLCDNREFTAASGWRPSLDLERGVKQWFDATGAAPHA